ncbi:hypothetical protein KJ673_02310 [Patescibacteria group bacterium]|nr:hypothetical protein [Patescibacteria group bacterium]MCG2687807.1 hypothetical protein [Candidatus Parcubacteria bacterium]
MERQEIHDRIRNHFYWQGWQGYCFDTTAIDACNSETTLVSMGVVDDEGLDTVLNIIKGVYGVQPTGITLETTFDQLVDAVLTLLP